MLDNSEVIRLERIDSLIKNAVDDLAAFTKSIGGDIASLGEERVVIVPDFIKIWRPETVISKKTPTAA